MTDEKIKIGDEEYTIDEIKAGMMKNEDYTRKTQQLAEEKRMLEANAENVKDLIELQRYAAERPELRSKLEEIMRAEQAKLAGVPYSSESDDEDDEEDEPKLSPKKIEAMMEERVQKALMAYENQQRSKKMQENFNKEITELKNRGYTPEELAIIAEYGKAKQMISPKDAANSLIVQEKISNKYKKKEEPAPAPILAGKAASGFDIENPEEELLKYDGDPAALLKAKADKFIIKD